MFKIQLVVTTLCLAAAPCWAQQGTLLVFDAPRGARMTINPERQTVSIALQTNIVSFSALAPTDSLFLADSTSAPWDVATCDWIKREYYIKEDPLKYEESKLEPSELATWSLPRSAVVSYDVDSLFKDVDTNCIRTYYQYRNGESGLLAVVCPLSPPEAHASEVDEFVTAYRFENGKWQEWCTLTHGLGHIENVGFLTGTIVPGMAYSW